MERDDIVHNLENKSNCNCEYKNRHDQNKCKVTRDITETCLWIILYSLPS